MKKILLSLLMSFSFFLFLCINIKNKPIFSYMYDAVSPATKSAQNAAENFFSKSVTSTQTYSKKLFDNSVPKVKDSVKSKMSARHKHVSEPAERITEEEKAELDQLIKNH